jgi:DNA-binding NarL/FixJ family response regulator
MLPAKVRMVTVLLVDDYPVMRQLLRDILERYPDIHIVGEAANGEEAVLQSTKLRPNVVIIDIELPTISSMEATTSIKLQCPLAAIIGLTAGAPDQSEVAMREAGAAAVLSKADLINTLYPAIMDAVSLTSKSAFASVSPRH